LNLSDIDTPTDDTESINIGYCNSVLDKYV